MRVFNFSAGPAVLPEPVLEQAAAEMLDLLNRTQAILPLDHNLRRPEGLPAFWNGAYDLIAIMRDVRAEDRSYWISKAESLAAANKRIANILRQAEAKGETAVNAELGALTEPAERALHEAIRAASEKARPLYEKGDYTGYLMSFAVLKAPVDTFFDKVMVMVDDEKLRRNRLALLRDLRLAMNRVADISRLAA